MLETSGSSPCPISYASVRPSRRCPHHWDRCPDDTPEGRSAHPYRHRWWNCPPGGPGRSLPHIRRGCRRYRCQRPGDPFHCILDGIVQPVAIGVQSGGRYQYRKAVVVLIAIGKAIAVRIGVGRGRAQDSLQGVIGPSPSVSAPALLTSGSRPFMTSYPSVSPSPSVSGLRGSVPGHIPPRLSDRRRRNQYRRSAGAGSARCLPRRRPAFRPPSLSELLGSVPRWYS